MVSRPRQRVPLGRLTAALDPTGEAASGLHRTVLASLPSRFRTTTGQDADIMLISGDQPGWRDRALAPGDARALMISGTRALTAAAARALIKESGIPITGCPTYASGNAWATALPQLTADMTASAVLDSVSVAPSLHAALVDQLAVIRPPLGRPHDLATAHASRGCYVLAGVVGGVAVTPAGTLSGARRLDLDLVGATRHWHARVDPVALASPARISVRAADGEYALPPLYEGPLRAAWAALTHAAGTRRFPIRPTNWPTTSP